MGLDMAENIADAWRARPLKRARQMFFVILVFVAGSISNAAQRPNFVFFLVDDLGWRDLGCYGSTFYETPHLDTFAKCGMLFTDAYAASPVCSPTRAAIMTGKYPPRVNITDWIPGESSDGRKLQTPADADQLPL